jgi:hypothetical protein
MKTIKGIKKILKIISVIGLLLLTGCTQYIDKPTPVLPELITDVVKFNTDCDYDYKLLINNNLPTNNTRYNWNWYCINNTLKASVTYEDGSNYSIQKIPNSYINTTIVKSYNYNFYNITINDFTTQINCDKLTISGSPNGGEWIAECDSKTLRVIEVK